MNKSNKIIRLPLFWKFAIVSTVIIIIFGSINVYFLWTSIYSSFEKEIDKRCTVLAKIVSDKAVTPMVYEDFLGLYNVLDEIKQSDPSISYIFILNTNNELVAHTHDISIPKSLIEVNELKKQQLNIKVVETRNYEYAVIRDIAYPILNGEIGTVRLGVVEEHIEQELIEATKDVLLMILSFFIFGLSGAFFFSYIITTPIKKISQKAQIIDLNYIDSEDYNIIRRKMIHPFNLHLNDELDVLVTKFSEMIIRLKNSYVELKETQGALAHAEKLTSLGTLSAGVAHEINNPISGINNCLNRIIKNPENTAQNERYIFLIKEAINKIEGVVQHMLNFSRKQDIVFEKINLNSVISNAIELSTLRFKNSELSMVFESSHECYVDGSANHLEQVIVNLILNSLEAINEKKESQPELLGAVKIALQKMEDRVLIKIEDNGIGISESKGKKIFDPFFTSKKVGKGTGLGLSVSFNLINEHKGNISFKSVEGVGTQFFIDLPCSKIELL